MKPWLALALIGLALPAQAACRTAGSKTAAMVAAIPSDAGADFNKALAAATRPETVEAAAKAAAGGCERPQHVSGEDSDAFPRILKQPGTPPAAVAFLAPVTFRHAGRPTTWYAVVNSFGSGAVLVTGLMDAIPDDSHLEKAMVLPNAGGFEPLGFDAATGKLVDKNVYLPQQLQAAAKFYQAP